MLTRDQEDQQQTHHQMMQESLLLTSVPMVTTPIIKYVHMIEELSVQFKD